MWRDNYNRGTKARHSKEEIAKDTLLSTSRATCITEQNLLWKKKKGTKKEGELKKKF